MKNVSTWSRAVNLGGVTNTEHREIAPYISPDGLYLFFSRRDKWQHATYSNIFWVSIEVVMQLKDSIETENKIP